jgi:hypothetical protein
LTDRLIIFFQYIVEILRPNERIWIKDLIKSSPGKASIDAFHVYEKEVKRIYRMIEEIGSSTFKKIPYQKIEGAPFIEKTYFVEDHVARSIKNDSLVGNESQLNKFGANGSLVYKLAKRKIAILATFVGEDRLSIGE